jgi:hypothetical protein
MTTIPCPACESLSSLVAPPLQEPAFTFVFSFMVYPPLGVCVPACKAYRSSQALDCRILTTPLRSSYVGPTLLVLTPCLYEQIRCHRLSAEVLPGRRLKMYRKGRIRTEVMVAIRKEAGTPSEPMGGGNMVALPALWQGFPSVDTIHPH